MFQILIFYKDDKAIEKYLRKFIFDCHCGEQVKKHIHHSGRVYYGSSFIVTCCKGLPEGAHGRKAHFVAVQEDLTWESNWPEIRNYIIKPLMLSPIPIHVFDGISYNEAVADEEARRAA